MSSVVCLHEDVSDDHFVTLRKFDFHDGGVDINQVQLEDQVRTVLDIQDLQLAAEGVQPEPGVQLVESVLPALTVKSVDVWLVVAQQGQGHGLLQGHQHQAGGPQHHHSAAHRHHHKLCLTASLTYSYNSWRL